MSAGVPATRPRHLDGEGLSIEAVVRVGLRAGGRHRRQASEAEKQYGRVHLSVEFRGQRFFVTAGVWSGGYQTYRKWRG